MVAFMANSLIGFLIGDHFDGSYFYAYLCPLNCRYQVGS